MNKHIGNVSVQKPENHEVSDIESGAHQYNRAYMGDKHGI